MRVLHIYSPKSPLLAQYVSLLTNDDDQRSTDNVPAFRLMCNDFQPDIVHLHGCMEADMVKAVLQARTQGRRIVLTPHGELEQSSASSLTGLNALPQLVTHAYALIARSPIERAALERLEWNRRIETVANPLITRTTNKEDCQSAHAAIYQKVMDSNVLELMDDATRAAQQTLLKAGITQDSRWVSPFDAQTVGWHQLFIYSKQEGIDAIVGRGMAVMGLQEPALWPAGGYLPDDYEQPAVLNSLTVVDIVKAIHGQYRRQQIPLLSLADLDAALRRDDVDDQLLMQQLAAEKADMFLAALLPVMQEQTGLDEGFMPCAPIDNKTTQRIRNIIKTHFEI